MLTITPEKFGYAEISPSGEFEAGSVESFTLTYTTGLFGIDDTGGIKVVFRLATDQTPPQFERPRDFGYTTVDVSGNAEAKLVYDVRGNKRPWYKMLQVRLTKGNLREGDTIKIRFGDRRFGSPGLRLQTFCEESFEFRVLVDVFSNQNYLRLPNSPSIRIVPGKPCLWKAILPTSIAAESSFRLAVKCEDQWGNPANQMDEDVWIKPNTTVKGLPEKISFEPGRYTAFVENLKGKAPGWLSIELHNDSGEKLASSNPMRITDRPDKLQFWADLHGQSEETVGTNTAKDYFLFARDRAFLDISAHQGNDFQITEDFWAHLNRITEEFNAANRFVTLPGYEWSGNTGLGGDRNVWFRREGEMIRRSSHALIPDEPHEDRDCHTAGDLFQEFSQSPEDVVVYAHVGGRYADLEAGHDGRIEHAVEIHSAWGTFEWLLNEAFDSNHRIGVVCNSDDHKGRPGASYPGASLFGAYGGLTCYLMPELSREALIEAMRRRHHYGTTGNRIYLDIRGRFENPITLFQRDPVWFDEPPVTAVEAIMGDIVKTSENFVSLTIDIHGSAPIERVQLFDGKKKIDTVRPFAREDLGGRVRILWEGAEYKGRGRAVNWKGRLQLEGNRIERLAPVNFWNVENTLKLEANRIVSWESITTGNFAGFDMWLRTPKDGVLNFESNHISFKLALTEVDYEDRCFEAGGLGKQVRLFRLPDDNRVSAMNFERSAPIRAKGDTRIYVKVTQEDGHLAWSSPIYLYLKDPP